ncbi:MAG: acyl-phosphate glycerol 3-phosphate acyltransferase [Woeseiaceae bacterium]|jgi:glycerol-3-phosphate acyltransferase PlsY|nr:acyl-phosphate glycerol 3-phosphate acyltransferase [Woeseiaceae bacterium]|tara:strand:+ start:562 stop:1215 length:654 start_codon:yes stop_codon:yes gene_type:complete
MFELAIKFLLSYLLGSVSGALTVGKLKNNTDIRKIGSGNAGATNALRTQGFFFALAVVIIDIGKGIIAPLYVSTWDAVYFSQEPQIDQQMLTLICAAAAVIGHVWPMWHQFRGGKGAATLLGAYLVISYPLVIVMLISFFVLLSLFGFVGLATVISGFCVCIYLLASGIQLSSPLFLFSFSMAIYLTYTHRSNISRLIKGSEPRNEKVMIFRKKKTK